MNEVETLIEAGVILTERVKKAERERDEALEYVAREKKVSSRLESKREEYQTKMINLTADWRQWHLKISDALGCQFLERTVTLEAARRLTAERDDAVKLMQTAYADGEQAIAEVTKLRLDLVCLQESTVDAKAYDALVAELEDLR